LEPERAAVLARRPGRCVAPELRPTAYVCLLAIPEPLADTAKNTPVCDANVPASPANPT
jgi:hypothetical protein